MDKNITEYANVLTFNDWNKHFKSCGIKKVCTQIIIFTRISCLVVDTFPIFSASACLRPEIKIFWTVRESEDFSFSCP